MNELKGRSKEAHDAYRRGLLIIESLDAVICPTNSIRKYICARKHTLSSVFAHIISEGCSIVTAEISVQLIKPGFASICNPKCRMVGSDETTQVIVVNSSSSRLAALRKRFGE